MMCSIFVSDRERSTGMVATFNLLATGITFRPDLGSVIRDLFRLLHAVRHGIVRYSDYPREAAASTRLAIIFGRIASGIPWFLRSIAVSMQLPHQCSH